jgi:hypothetical protein
MIRSFISRNDDTTNRRLLIVETAGIISLTNVILLIFHTQPEDDNEQHKAEQYILYQRSHRFADRRVRAPTTAATQGVRYIYIWTRGSYRLVPMMTTQWPAAGGPITTTWLRGSSIPAHTRRIILTGVGRLPGLKYIRRWHRGFRHYSLKVQRCIFCYDCESFKFSHCAATRGNKMSPVLQSRVESCEVVCEEKMAAQKTNIWRK